MGSAAEALVLKRDYRVIPARRFPPARGRGRRIYGLPPLPPTSDFAFMCYCVCVCVSGVMRLWDCGVVSLWVCGLVFSGFVCLCVHMFVFVWVLCVFV